MSHKSLWAAIALLVVFSMIISACGGAATPAPAKPAAEPTAAPAAAEPTRQPPGKCAAVRDRPRREPVGWVPARSPFPPPMRTAPRRRSRPPQAQCDPTPVPASRARALWRRPGRRARRSRAGERGTTRAAGNGPPHCCATGDPRGQARGLAQGDAGDNCGRRIP